VKKLISTREFLQRSHFPLHLKQPRSEGLAEQLVFLGLARISLMFFAVLKEGMMEPLGKIFAKLGES